MKTKQAENLLYKPALAVLATAALLATTGCENFPSTQAAIRSDRVGQKEAGSVETAQLGTVVSTRSVKVERGAISTGSVVGAGAGAVAGHQFGSGTGKTLATVGGGLIGGLVGHAIEDKAAPVEGFEILIQLDRGGVISVVQGNDAAFVPGDRVAVIAGAKTRITKIPASTPAAK